MTSIERPLSVVVYLYVQQMHKRSHRSVVYERAGMHFFELQNLQKHRAMDGKSFYINDDVFLATAFQPAESFIEVGIEVRSIPFKTLFLPMGPGPCTPLSCAVKVKHFLVRLISIGVSPTR